VSWAIWISGPPASGKTTMACAAAELLRARGEPVLVLEFDAIRPRLVPDPKDTETERELVHRALGYMAAQLTKAEIPVIVDATAPRRRWRELARANIRRFAEVQLQCPVEVRRERERNRAGGRAPTPIHAREGGSPVSSVDVLYELAPAPELIIDTSRDDVAVGAAAVASLAERLAVGAPPGRIGVMRWAIWITGRPGSGKTTLSRRVADLLATEPVPTVVLDLGFARRFIVGRGWATDAQEEVVHRTLALTAKLLTEAGVAVILDATAPRRAWRELGREWIAHFAEVQLICPAEVCAARERAARWHLGGARLDPPGEGTAAPDIAFAYEESLYPELRLHTHAPDLTMSIEEVLRLARRLERTATRRATARS
jgi:adenylylsulfate kinase